MIKEQKVKQEIHISSTWNKTALTPWSDEPTVTWTCILTFPISGFTVSLRWHAVSGWFCLSKERWAWGEAAPRHAALPHLPSDKFIRPWKCTAAGVHWVAASHSFVSESAAAPSPSHTHMHTHLTAAPMKLHACSASTPSRCFRWKIISSEVYAHWANLKHKNLNKCVCMCVVGGCVATPETDSSS